MLGLQLPLPYLHILIIAWLGVQKYRACITPLLMEPQKCMGDCGMIKKGEHMIKVENTAETGERAWLEENDQF